MVRVRLYAVLCLALGCTCEPAPESPAPEQSEPEPALFHYAPLSVAPEEVPPAFGAPLPANVEEWRLWGPEFPPRGHVEDLLLWSDEMRDRFGTAVAAALAHGDSMEDVLTTHGAMVRWLEPDECGWLGEWAERDGTPALARRFFWIEYATCAPVNDDVDPFARDDLPPRAVFARFEGQLEAGDFTLRPPLVETLRRVLAEESRSGEFALTPTGVSMLLRFDEGTEAALQLRREFPQASDVIDVLFRGEDNPDALRLFTSYCQRLPNAPECRSGSPRWTRSPELIPLTRAPEELPLREEVLGYDFDARAFVLAHPEQRDAVQEALVACAGEQTYAELLCLKNLALLDRPSARELARSFGTAELAEMRALLRVLRGEAEGDEAVGARLASLDLIPDAVAEAEDAVTPLDYLRAARCALQFDVETGIFPNEHDSLLRRLAALAPEALEGTVFGEESDMDGPYELHAWRDGQKWSTSAENLGDWYDVSAVIGMLNALARSAESDQRWLAVVTDDQTATIVTGSQDGLQTAVDEGLLEPADAEVPDP